MIKLRSFDTFGDLHHGFHEGLSLLIHSKNEQIVVYDFENLSEFSRISFKLPIIRTLIPIMNKQLGFRCIIVTEDQFAHLLVLKQNLLKVSTSLDLNQPVTLSIALLLDAQLRSYVICENGTLAQISKKCSSKSVIAWPPKQLKRVHHIEPFERFQGQKLITDNSASFFAYHYTDESVHITSWILTFTPKKRVFAGPYSLKISPFSIYLSPYFFIQKEEIYSVIEKKSIGSISNVYCVSTYSGDSSIISNSDGELYRIKGNKFDKLRELSSPPLKIEYNGEKYVYLTSNGLINDKLQIGASFPISFWSGIFVCGGYPKISAGPLISEPIRKPCAITVEENGVTSNTKGKWTSPHTIIASNSVRIGQYDFFVAATAGTVHVLKSHLKNPSILPITEFNWESPVSAVAINSKCFAVASIDNIIKVQSYTGDDYSYKFESSFCVQMSMSETTLAYGYHNGTFGMSSLKDKNETFNIRPFRISISKVDHIDEDTVLVQWGCALAKVSPKSIEWIKLPTYDGAMTAVLARHGIISLARPNSVDVFSFADQVQIAQVPKRAVGMCVNGRRTFVLTISGEVLVLHFHSSIKVEERFSVADNDNFHSIIASENAVFIVCQKIVAIYSRKGDNLGEIELTIPPRYCDCSSCGIYLVFSRSVWFVENKDKIKKISFDCQNICGFSAADDVRYVIASAGKIFFCDHSGPKPSFSTLAKYTKTLIGIKCFSTQVLGNVDSVYALFIDHSSTKWQIPQPKVKSTTP